MQPNFDWRDAIEQLFASTLNQESLEDVSKFMLSFSCHDPDYHSECLFLFEKGKELARQGDASIIGYVNKSGYKISSLGEALEIITDFEREYLKAYSEQSST